MGFLTCTNTTATMTNAYIQCGGGDYQIVNGADLSPDSLVYHAPLNSFSVSSGGHYIGSGNISLIPFSDVPDTGYLLEVPDHLDNDASTREQNFFQTHVLGDNYFLSSFNLSGLSTLRSSQVSSDPFLENVQTGISDTVNTTLLFGSTIIALVVIFVIHHMIVRLVRNVK